MMYIDEPVDNWGQKMDQDRDNFGSIGLSFCGFLTATFYVAFDNDMFVKDFSLALLKLFEK